MPEIITKRIGIGGVSSTGGVRPINLSYGERIVKVESEAGSFYIHTINDRPESPVEYNADKLIFIPASNGPTVRFYGLPSNHRLEEFFGIFPSTGGGSWQLMVFRIVD